MLYGYKTFAEWGAEDILERYEEHTGLLLLDIPKLIGKDEEKYKDDIIGKQ